MALIYSTPLLRGAIGPANTTYSWTNPGPGRAVARNFDMVNSIGQQSELLVRVQGSYFWHPVMGTTDQDRHFESRVVIMPGETLYVTDVKGNCYWQISGYVFSS